MVLKKLNCNLGIGEKTETTITTVRIPSIKKLVALKRAVCCVPTDEQQRLLATDLGCGGLLGQKHGLDVRQNTTLGDGDTGQELVQLLVVADGELEMTRDDSRLLVVTSSVARELEHLSRQVLHNGRQVDWCSGSDALGVVALTQQTVDSADGELKSGSARAALRLSLNFASLSSSRHIDENEVSQRVADRQKIEICFNKKNPKKNATMSIHVSKLVT